MSMGRIYRLWMPLGLAGIALGFFLLSACSEQAPPGSEEATTRPAEPDKSLGGRGAAQVWAQTCNRCHNAPSPDRFNAAQWDVVMRHMRYRGSLTEAEHRVILEFLQASSQ